MGLEEVLYINAIDQENRKRKVLISSLEQRQRLKLEELKLQAPELDRQIADVKFST